MTVPQLGRERLLPVDVSPYQADQLAKVAIPAALGEVTGG